MCAGPSLDDLVGSYQERLGDGQPEGLGDLHVDHEFELRWLLHWEVGRFGALEDLVDIYGSATADLGAPRSVGNQAAGDHVVFTEIHGWQPNLRGELCDFPASATDDRVAGNDETLNARLMYPREGRADLIWPRGRKVFSRHAQVAGYGLDAPEHDLIGGIVRVAEKRDTGQPRYEFPE